MKEGGGTARWCVSDTVLIVTRHGSVLTENGVEARDCSREFLTSKTLNCGTAVHSRSSATMVWWNNFN